MGSFLRLFGGLRVEAEDGSLSARAVQRKRLALLALLARAPGGRLSRDKLVAFLWPESDVERARHQLASSVYELRKALGEDAIVSAADDVVLDLAKLPNDVAEFEAALTAGNRESAVGLYAGPFLDGFFVSDAADFERWVEGERTRLAQAYAKALEDLAGAAASRGDTRAAVEWWRKLAAHDLYNTRVAKGLIEALVAAGDRAGALQHARIHTEAVRGALGVEPDPAITALATRLRAAAAEAQPSGLARADATAREPRDDVSVAASAVPAPLVDAPFARSTQPATPRHERRSQRAAVAIGAIAMLLTLSLLAGTGGWQRLLNLVGTRAEASRRLPVVLLMDSPHPSRVYDEEVIAANGTNADVLNDVLRDLPVQRVKETAGPYWHRHEEVRQLRPDLVVIHLSAFCQERCEPERIKMRAFVEYLADTDAKFLIYSRMPADTFAVQMNEMLGDLPNRFPRLAQRIHPFVVRAHGTPHWKDPATAAALKLQVKDILGLK